MSLKTFFHFIKRAIQGESHDYTKGNLVEAIILLAIPMILELSLESIFAVVDMFFVSRLGANAIATVGLTESVTTIIYSIAIGVSTGATAIVARRVGEKDYEAGAHAGAQAILLALMISIVLGVIGVLFPKEILELMGAKSEVVSEGFRFTQIMIGANLPILLLFLINGIFRGAGDAAMAMKSLWVASALNIILCPLFIHFWGIEGAALATVVGRSSGVGYQLYHLLKGDGVLKYLRRHFLWDVKAIRALIAIAWPASLQFIIGSGSWIILTRLVAEVGGTSASAGYQIAFRNFAFFILPAWGVSNAAATLVGQCLGANNAQRAQESIFKTAQFSAVFMFLVTVLIMVFGDSLVHAFTVDQSVFDYGVEALKIIGAGYVFYGVGMVFTQALNGAGETRIPTWINIFCFWIFQGPFAYWFVYVLKLGPKGAIISVPLSHALLCLVSWFIIRQGRWKSVKV